MPRRKAGEAEPRRRPLTAGWTSTKASRTPLARGAGQAPRARALPARAGLRTRDARHPQDWRPKEARSRGSARSPSTRPSSRPASLAPVPASMRRPRHAGARSWRPSSAWSETRRGRGRSRPARRQRPRVGGRDARPWNEPDAPPSTAGQPEGRVLQEQPSSVPENRSVPNPLAGMRARLGAVSLAGRHGKIRDRSPSSEARATSVARTSISPRKPARELRPHALFPRAPGTGRENRDSPPRPAPPSRPTRWTWARSC